MSAQVQPHLTPEQYLQLDRKSDTRSEYYNGRMFAMSGGIYNHARIAANLFGELYNGLKKTSCYVCSNDLRVRVAPAGLYTYPDILIACGEPKFADGEKDTLLNPTLIVEVLSPSTEAYDHGFKSAQYRKITSLREYVLVSQDEARVEIFRRQENGNWLLSEWAGLDAACRFDSIDRSVALSDIYAGINWPGEDSLSARPSPVS
jgi:Uma2 family endonuclease